MWKPGAVQQDGNAKAEDWWTWWLIEDLEGKPWHLCQSPGWSRQHKGHSTQYC